MIRGGPLNLDCGRGVPNRSIRSELFCHNRGFPAFRISEQHPVGHHLPDIAPYSDTPPCRQSARGQFRDLAGHASSVASSATWQSLSAGDALYRGPSAVMTRFGSDGTHARRREHRLCTSRPKSASPIREAARSPSTSSALWNTFRSRYGRFSRRLVALVRHRLLWQWNRSRFC